MKKHAVITMTTGDQFEELFDSKQEAIRAADRDWSVMLTKHDKLNITDFFVAEVDLDDDGIINLDTATIIKTYRWNGKDTTIENEEEN